MEYPSKNDIFLKFKALYDENDKFQDYVLVDASENFHNVIDHKVRSLIGKKVIEIVTGSLDDTLNLKTIYFHMLPLTRSKYEVYNEESERWYLISIFSDEKDYLFLFYSEITRYKKGIKVPRIKSYKDSKRKIKSII